MDTMMEHSLADGERAAWSSGTAMTTTTPVKSAIGRGGDLRIDYLMVAFSIVFIGGLYADGWAHEHHLVDSFFTPWHAVLYSGFFASGLALVIVLVSRLRAGRDMAHALPVGYWWMLGGVALFFAGGVFDLLWHTLFGIEANVDALLSPSHLILATAGVLVVTGPIRAALARPLAHEAPSWRAILPAVLALGVLLAQLSFFTAYANPFHAPLAQARAGGDAAVIVSSWSLADLVQGLGVASVLLYSALLMGILLFAIRRWQLPVGAMTLLIGTNVLLITTTHAQYRLVPAAVGAGIVADLLLLLTRPSVARVRMVRLFAFVVPFTLFLLYFGTLALTGGIAWSIHLWLGTAVLAGIGGLLLSYAFVAPQRTEKPF